MSLCLKVGVGHAKELAKTNGLPLIPIHHMEAHALTPLLSDAQLKFPFIICLLSGGHSILAVAKDIDAFELYGSGLDSSPGQVLDKISRSLNVASLDNGKYSDIAGGAAIENLAINGNPFRYIFTDPRSSDLDCDFSFSGLFVAALRITQMHDLNLNDFSASLQLAFAKHINKRIQRLIDYLNQGDSPPASSIVLSGGVASNNFLRAAVQYLASQNGLHFSAPPQRLCTDNGVMIAWNGALLHERGLRIHHDIDTIDYNPVSPLGEDCRHRISESAIRTRPLNYKAFLDKYHCNSYVR